MSLFRKAPPPEAPAGRRRPMPNSTPEARPQAFSYYAQRSTAAGRSERLSAEEVIAPQSKPASPLSKATTVMSYMLLVGSFLFATLLVPNPRIQAVTSHGSAYFMQDQSLYQQEAAKDLSGSLLNRNKLTVNTDKVANDLMTNFPELQSAAVEIPLIGAQPTVKVTPYLPSMMLTTASGGMYLIDSTGRALVSASQISNTGELDVPTVQDTAISDVHLGSQVLSTHTANFVQQVAAILKAANVSYGRLNLPTGTSELDVPISGQPYYVKFNLQDDPRQQAGTFLAVRGRLASDKVTPGQYIDVRLLGRAYYK